MMLPYRYRAPEQYLHIVADSRPDRVVFRVLFSILFWELDHWPTKWLEPGDPMAQVACSFLRLSGARCVIEDVICEHPAQVGEQHEYCLAVVQVVELPADLDILSCTMGQPRTPPWDRDSD